jgi:hypothetical protein
MKNVVKRSTSVFAENVTAIEMANGYRRGGLVYFNRFFGWKRGGCYEKETYNYHCMRSGYGADYLRDCVRSEDFWD